MGVIGACVAILFVLLLIGALASPRYALLLLIVLFPLKQLLQASFGYFQSNGAQINIAVALAAGFVVIQCMSRGVPVLRGYWQGVTACIALFYSQVLLGVLYTPAQARPAAIYFLSDLWPYAILLFVLMPMLMTRLEDFRRVVPLLMFFGGLITVLIIIHPQARDIAGRFVLIIGPPRGGSETTGNPLATAELGGMLLIAGVLFRPEAGNRLHTAIRIFAIAAGLAIAVRSGSRGQFLMATGCAALMIPLAYRVKNIGGFIAGCLGVLLVLVVAFAAKELLVTGEGTRRWDANALLEGLFARLNEGGRIFSQYVSSPVYYLTGMGTSAYNAFSSDARSYGYPHNTAIEAITEYGLMGVTILCSALYLTFRWGKRLIGLYREDPAMRGAAAILAAVTLYSVLLSLKQGSLISLPTFFGWMIMLAKVGRAEIEMVAHEHAQYEHEYSEYTDADGTHHEGRAA